MIQLSNGDSCLLIFPFKYGETNKTPLPVVISELNSAGFPIKVKNGNAIFQFSKNLKWQVCICNDDGKNVIHLQIFG